MSVQSGSIKKKKEKISADVSAYRRYVELEGILTNKMIDLWRLNATERKEMRAAPKQNIPDGMTLPLFHKEGVSALPMTQEDWDNFSQCVIIVLNYEEKILKYGKKLGEKEFFEKEGCPRVIIHKVEKDKMEYGVVQVINTRATPYLYDVCKLFGIDMKHLQVFRRGGDGIIMEMDLSSLEGDDEK